MSRLRSNCYHQHLIASTESSESDRQPTTSTEGSVKRPEPSTTNLLLQKCTEMSGTIAELTIDNLDMRYKLEKLGALTAQYKTKCLDEEKKRQEEEDKHEQLKNKVFHLEWMLLEKDAKLRNPFQDEKRLYEIDNIYQDLTTNMWSLAMDDLDVVYPSDKSEQSKLRFLNQILLFAEQKAKARLRNYRHFLQQTLKDPLSRTKLSAQPSKPFQSGSLAAPFAHFPVSSKVVRVAVTSESGVEGLEEFDNKLLDESMITEINRHLMTSANSTDTKQLEEDVLTAIHCDYSMRSFKDQLKNETQVGEYIAGACRLVWLMATHCPPLEFVTTGYGQPPSSVDHELFYSCSRNSTHVISSYVYPILKYRGTTRQKGKVYVVPKEQYKQQPQ